MGKAAEVLSERSVKFFSADYNWGVAGYYTNAIAVCSRPEHEVGAHSGK